MSEANREEHSVDKLPMEPGDSVVAGPGLAATKSQIKGAGAGIALGAIGGVVIGVIVGLLIGGTAAIIISAICFGVGGGTAGAVIGGFVKPKHDSPMEGGSRT